MSKLRVEQYVVGMVMTNCYFAVNTQTMEVLIIDPGAEAEKLILKITENGLRPAAILLTHGHFDHAGVARQLADHYKIKIYAHEAEKATLEDPAINLSSMGGISTTYAADEYLSEENDVYLAGFDIKVLFTPGHTSGGCCYYFEEEHTLFSGDTLFSESIGRTDFPGGSYATLIRSIQEKLLVLPGHVDVYAGHNDATTIGWEREHNPFI